MRARNYYAIVLMAALMACGQIQAQVNLSADDPLASFDKLASLLNVNSVMGKPVQSGKATVIPLARISFSLGAGGSFTGFGGGMGGKVIPYGLLVIEGDEARVELFPVEEKKPSFLQEMLPVLLKILPDIMGKKSPPASKTGSKEAKVASSAEANTLDGVKKLFDEGKLQEALGAIDALLENSPDNAEYHAWKGNIMGTLAGSGNPLDMMKYGMGAMQEFETALELDPENSTAHFGRGMGRLMAPEGFGRDYDGAVEDFGFVCKNSPSAESYYYLGLAYQGKGEKDKAVDAFKKAISLKPDYPEAAKALSNIK